MSRSKPRPSRGPTAWTWTFAIQALGTPLEFTQDSKGVPSRWTLGLEVHRTHLDRQLGTPLDPLGPSAWIPIGFF
jgi:hypothetical protein